MEGFLAGQKNGWEVASEVSVAITHTRILYIYIYNIYIYIISVQYNQYNLCTRSERTGMCYGTKLMIIIKILYYPLCY